MTRFDSLGNFARKTIVAGFAIQLLIAVPLILYIWNCPDLGKLLVDPSLPLTLKQTIPDVIARLRINLLIGFLFLAAFIYYEHKKAPLLVNKISEWFSLFLVSFFLYTIVVFYSLQFPFCLDDAYIDFRYVYRWINGLGFDYNPGESIMGFTSHLHLMLLAFISMILKVQNIALVSQLINLYLTIGAYFLLFFTTQKVFKKNILAAISVSIFAMNPLNLAHCIVGKEGSLVIFLVILTIWLVVNNRWRWLPWTASALALTRPEGIFFLATSFIFHLFNEKEKKKLLFQWLPPLAVIATYYLFLLVHFGTVIPHGAIGRSTMFHSIWDPGDRTSFFILKQCGIDTFFRYVAMLFAFDLEKYQLAWLVQGCIALLLLLEFSFKEKWLKLYSISAFIILLFFTICDPWFFPWYYSWFAFVAPLLIPLVLRALLPFILNLRAYPSVILVAILFALSISVPLIADLPPVRTLHLLNEKASLKATMWPILKNLRSYTFAWNDGQDRLLTYKEATQYLANKKGNLATWEPGIIGYSMPDRKILDLGGLVSEEPVKYYPVPNGERTRLVVWGSIPPESVDQLKPDRVIFLDSFADNGLLMDKNFIENYQLERFWPGKIWSSNGVYLFKKVGDGEGFN